GGHATTHGDATGHASPGAAVAGAMTVAPPGVGVPPEQAADIAAQRSLDARPAIAPQGDGVIAQDVDRTGGREPGRRETGGGVVDAVPTGHGVGGPSAPSSLPPAGRVAAMAPDDSGTSAGRVAGQNTEGQHGPTARTGEASAGHGGRSHLSDDAGGGQPGF